MLRNNYLYFHPISLNVVVNYVTINIIIKNSINILLFLLIIKLTLHNDFKKQ